MMNYLYNNIPKGMWLCKSETLHKHIKDVTITSNGDKSSLGCAQMCVNDWWRRDPTIRWMTDEVGKAERYVIRVVSAGM